MPVSTQEGLVMPNSSGTIELDPTPRNLEKDSASEKKNFNNGPFIKQKLTFTKDGKYFVITKEEKFVYPFNYLSKMIQNSFPANKG